VGFGGLPCFVSKCVFNNFVVLAAAAFWLTLILPGIELQEVVDLKQSNHT
jgi:hypothetical protein